MYVNELIHIISWLPYGLYGVQCTRAYIIRVNAFYTILVYYSQGFYSKPCIVFFSTERQPI